MVLKLLVVGLGFPWSVGSVLFVFVDFRVLLIVVDFITLLTFMDFIALLGKSLAGFSNRILVSVVFVVRRCGILIAISDGIERNCNADSYYI